MSFSYSTVVDRIYKRFACEYYDNIAYLHHPSGVTVVVLREKLESEVTEVDFGSTKKKGVHRAEQVVIGKGKKVNDRLQIYPDLVRTASENQGYIAIITFGAGKRKPDDFITPLHPKRVVLRQIEVNDVHSFVQNFYIVTKYTFQSDATNSFSPSTTQLINPVTNHIPSVIE
uniref:VWFA domain-containing protein n=1 Tax=Heterorhabditis bacteriophora TaxID=37862 RepID=A0A1I7WZ40_HETBA